MYNRYPETARRFLMRGECPVTLSILLLTVALFVASGLAPGAWADWYRFSPIEWWLRPWTLVTGSLFAGDLLTLLFGIAWLWIIGGSLERSLGSRTFLGLWCATSAAIGLGLFAANLLAHRAAPILFFPVLDALTVAWALYNRDALVMFMFAIPLRAITLAWIGIGFTLYMYAGFGFVTALFSLTGALLCWGFVEFRARRRRMAGTIRIPRRRPQREEENRGLFDRFRSSQRDRRIQKLLRDSEVDTPDSLQDR